MTQHLLYSYKPKPDNVTNAVKILETLADRSENVLFRVSSTFPFDLFPDELIIDETKVTIINRNFFASEQVFTIGFASIIDVTIETAPFFATLHIRDRGWSTVISIRYLPKEKAVEALKILQGILILQSKNLDITTLSHKHILKNVQKVGHSHVDTLDNTQMTSRLPS